MIVERTRRVGGWPLAQRGPDTGPVPIVAAGRLLADPALDAGLAATDAGESCAAEPPIADVAGGPAGPGASVPADRSGGRAARAGVAKPVGPRPPVRLTRRGRLVLLAVLVFVLAAIGALVALPSQAAAPAGPPRVVVVQPGDSLWTIAQRYRPGADPVRAVRELREANGIDGSMVVPGEELVLPARW